MEIKRRTGEFVPNFEGDYINKKMLAVVKNAGDLAVGLQESGLLAHEKTSKEDLVTQGDTQVTELLKSQLREQYPEIVFVDEETAESHLMDVSKPGLYAVIDPIDGTGNYYKKYKNIIDPENADELNVENWGISIGFVKDGEVVAGIIYQPSVNKMFYSEKGRGAFVNNQRLAVTHNKLLPESTSYFDFPYPKDKLEYDQTVAVLSKFASKLQASEPIKLGSQVIEIMKIAEGEADFFFHLKTKPWDVAAAINIVTEAGGQIMNRKGEHYQLFDESIVVTNGVIELQPFFELVNKL